MASPRTLPPRSLLLLVVALLASTLGYVAVTPTPASAVGLHWADGGFQYSTVVNCTSMIQGQPYAEYGVGSYVGQSINPDSGQPTPGQVFYVHVVVGGTGNPCNGSYVGVEIRLPSGVTPAISGSAPLRCLFNGVPLAAGECPTSLASGSGPGLLQIRSPYGSPYLWPVAQGKTFDFQIPVVASTTMSNATLGSKLSVVDGYDDPVLTPSAPLYVFPTVSGGGGSSSPVIEYPSPSTTRIGPRAAYSTSYLFTKGLGGNAYFDLGTSPGNYSLYTDGPAAVPAGDSGGWEVWSDWTPYPLQPSTTYYWRMRFVASNGTTTFGAQQQFTTASDGTAVVGTGTAASCTTAALSAAYSTAASTTNGRVRFNCGFSPVTITQAATVTFTKNVTVDGGGLVTLRPSGGVQLFRAMGGETHLKGLVLTGADHGGCGGALHVGAGGTGLVEGSRLINNRAANGGGACAASGGYLSLWNSTVSGNVATAAGGGLHSAGNVDVSSTEVAGNTATGNGGGIEIAAGTFDIRFSTVAANKAGPDGATGTRGGGVHTTSAGFGGIIASTISGNAAGRGGGVSFEGLNTPLSSTTVAGNSARSASAAGGIEATSTSLADLSNTLLHGNSPQNCSADAALRRFNSVASNLDSGSSCALAGASDRQNAQARLGPLERNGGPTRTHALLPGSAAIDRGSLFHCSNSDQRGVRAATMDRAIDGDLDGTAACDIGAFELEPDGSPGAPRSVTATGGTGQATVAWQAPANNGGNAVNGYEVTPVRAGVAQPPRLFASTATSQVLTGLSAGSYTFTVRARNSAGLGAVSGSSATVTVTAPVGPPGTYFVPVVPCRVVDTRVAGGALSTNVERQFQVGGTGAGFAAQGGKAGGCGVPDGAAAVEATVTAVSPGGTGYFRAWPAGAAAPNATFLNYGKALSATNTGALALAPTGAKDLATRNVGPVGHYVIDVQGYFATSPAAATVFVPMAPCRVVDTRAGGGALASNAERSFQVAGTGSRFAGQGGKPGGCAIPDGAAAVEATVTAVSPSGAGFFRAWPAGAVAPNATFLNYGKGLSTTNTGALALAASGTDDLATRNAGSRSHYVIDVQGYYLSAAARPVGGSVFVPIVPCRVVDTRAAGGALATNVDRSFQVGGTGSGFAAQGGTAGGCGTPDGATAVEATVTAVSPSGSGYFRAWPAGTPQPNATFLNYGKGLSATNTGALALAPTGTQDLTARNVGPTGQYVIDVQGYFRAQP